MDEGRISQAAGTVVPIDLEGLDALFLARVVAVGLRGRWTAVGWWFHSVSSAMARLAAHAGGPGGPGDKRVPIFPATFCPCTYIDSSYHNATTPSPFLAWPIPSPRAAHSISAGWLRLPTELCFQPPPLLSSLKPSCPARHNSHRRCRKRRTARQDNCEEREEGSPSMARTAVVCLVQMCRASSSHGRVRTSKEEPRAGHGADATLMADETGDWIRSNLFFPPRLASLTGLDDPDVLHHHDRGGEVLF